jgi:hypothetical protein
MRSTDKYSESNGRAKLKNNAETQLYYHAKCLLRSYFIQYWKGMEKLSLNSTILNLIYILSAVSDLFHT